MLDDLYILAFDHDEQFEAPCGDDFARIVAAKRLMFEAALRAVDSEHPSRTGVLVDVLYGGDIAVDAATAGLTLGTAIDVPLSYTHFDFRDPEWKSRVEALRPDLSKALFFYNVDGDAEKNRRQLDKLLELQDFLAEVGLGMMAELIVEPEPHQLERVGSDVDRFERELRPELIYRAMVELQKKGLAPITWKIEGIDDPHWCARVGKLALAQGEDVGCLVLGSGASEDTVLRWLRVAGSTPGYRGFAVGRTIWDASVQKWAKGEMSDEDTIDAVNGGYVRMIEAFRSGRSADLAAASAAGEVAG